MIIKAINTQRIPNTVAFKGSEKISTPMRVIQEQGKATSAVPVTDGYIKNIFTKGLEDAKADATVLDDADNVITRIFKRCTQYLCRSEEEVHTAVSGLAQDNNLGKTVEVIKEVPAKAGAATAAAATTTKIPWKKYGPIAAVAAVAVGVAAFFIGKSAEKNHQAKLEEENGVVVGSKQPQPVLQEAAKPDSNLQDFFSAPK